jgi:hypothetical protein
MGGTVECCSHHAPEHRALASWHFKNVLEEELPVPCFQPSLLPLSTESAQISPLVEVNQLAEMLRTKNCKFVDPFFNIQARILKRIGELGLLNLRVYDLKKNH